MELAASILMLSSVILLFLLLLSLSPKLLKNGSKQRPPGPPGWPIIGNMFDLGSLPHRTMYELRPKYGPLLWLKLGSVNTLVVQSANAAAEFFKNHDLAFCDRWCPQALTARNYNLESVSLSPYGPYWRHLRRLYSTKLLAKNETLIQKRVDDMVRNIEEESAAGVARGESGEVDLSRLLFVMSFNVVANLSFSRDLLDLRDREGHEFYDAMSKVVELAGKPNLADFVPWLKWLDPQGMKRNMTRQMERVSKIVSGFIEEKVQRQSFETELSGKRDFLDALLESSRRSDDGEDSQTMSKRAMTSVVMEMFIAGSETTSNTLEWTLAELLRNPETLRKVKDELNRVIGSRITIDESDIDKLSYLQAVLKETLRLHPVVPLLIPRNTLEDTNYMDYIIPKGTQVLVNVWAIGRDPDVWKEPSRFYPERFLESHANIDYKGQNYELIPFGSGRRMCVGIPLAYKVLHITMASLLHCFDWKLSDDVSSETIDMNDKPGISARKLIPLKVIPKKLHHVGRVP